MKIDNEVLEILKTNKFASPIKDVRDKIIYYSDTIIEHIIKVICYGHSLHKDCFKHWCHEITIDFNKCLRLKIKQSKGKDRLPTSKELNAWILSWFQKSSDIEGLINYLASKYGDIDLSCDDLYDLVIEKLSKLCNLVTSKQFTNYDIENIFNGGIDI